MSKRNPERNFEHFWEVFHNRYPFFKLRKVNWNKQYEIYRPRVTSETSDAELFDILCQMVDPLDDGHVEIRAKIDSRKQSFTAEKPTRFGQEFPEAKELFKIAEATLVANGFAKPKATEAWMLRYGRSPTCGYIRILELEDVKKRELNAALDSIAADFKELSGYIVDIRDCPGGEDRIAVAIINRFCDRKRVAFHWKTKIGPGGDDFSDLRSWHLEPQGDVQFTGPIAVLTSDSVFSGGEAFALAMKELPYVTMIGEHTNGIFSYTLDKTLPNGWEYCLSYQQYYSADMVCYEGKGVPVDIKLCNTRADIKNGVDPLIVRALDVLKSRERAGRARPSSCRHSVLSRASWRAGHSVKP